MYHDRVRFGEDGKDGSYERVTNVIWALGFHTDACDWFCGPEGDTISTQIRIYNLSIINLHAKNKTPCIMYFSSE